MRDVVVVDSVRTGLAKSHRGTFNLTRPDDMVAHCINALLDRNAQLCLLYTSPSPRDLSTSRMPSSA